MQLPEVGPGLITLQALSDAITCRRGRLQAPCRAGGTGSRCAVHGNDEYLIASYQEQRAAVLRDVQATLGPGDEVTIRQLGDGAPPAVALFSAALMAELRQMAADNPAIPTPLSGPAPLTGPFS